MPPHHRERAMTECEFFLAMNEDGGWIVTNDESDALPNLAENEGGWHARVVKLVVKMTPPQAQEITVTVPDTAGETATVEVV